MRTVDLFAGWGGFTLGATQAGADVVFAANHWPLAVEAHAANHPSTQHACQDLRQIDWRDVPRHELLLASPACQGHSSAANGSRAGEDVAARHAALRATAGAVTQCVEVCRPEVFIVENVPRFARWGPAERPGLYFEHWLEGLRIRDYTVEVRKVWAHHYDTPQRRLRLFIIGSRGPRIRPLPYASAEPAFGPHIEWEANVPWTLVSDATPAVRNRINRSRPRHGRRFLTQHTSDHHGTPLSESIRTITGGDQWAVVDGNRYRPLTIRENARAMGFPDSYRWPDIEPNRVTRGDIITGLGNAVCPPVAKTLVGAVASSL